MLRKLLKKHRKPSTEESLPCEQHTSSQQTQQPETLSTQASCGLQSADNDVLCTGWLEKSPPEKKLGHYAWKKRWFILRSGQMSGAPGVLEYYKNEHSKKPLQIINLNFCTQLGIRVTFSKKELEKSFMFDIKTNERTFYLEAETEADRNRWVQSICQICGFSQTKESTDTLRNLSSVNHRFSSSRAEFSSSSQPLLQARRSSALSQSSQPRLTSHTQPASSNSAPQEHQHLHQRISRRRENARNASFSQSTRQESDTAAQKLAQGNRHCIHRVSSQVHDFSSLPKPSQYSGFVPPRSLASHSHTKGSFTVSAADSKDVYTFKSPRNSPRRELGDLPMDSATAPPPLHPRTPRGSSLQQRSPDSYYKYPTGGGRTTCWHDKSPKNTIMVQSDNASFSQSNVQESDTAAQKLAQGNRHSIHRVSSQVPDFYRLPKPSQYSGFVPPHSLASPSHTKAGFSVSASDSEDMYTFKEPRNTPCSEFGDLPVDSAISPPPLPPKTPRGSSPQQRPPDSDYKYPTRDGETACCRDKSPKKTIVGLPHNASSDDSYVSINPGSDIPMSTMPLHIASRGSKIQPPPVYRHLKPGRKAKPETLDMRDNTVINELPFKSPVTKPWSTVNNTFNPSSSQYCRSISITDSGDCEENYVPMQNLTSSSPLPSGTNNPAPKKSTGNVNYIDPDFQLPSSSPQHKPSTSSVTSDEKGEYVQTDEEKNQALQKSIQESTKMQQS